MLLLCLLEQVDKPERPFQLGPALAYLANMRVFWLLCLGLGACCLALPCTHCACQGCALHQGMKSSD